MASQACLGYAGVYKRSAASAVFTENLSWAGNSAGHSEKELIRMLRTTSLASRGLPPTYQEYGERSSRPSVVCIHGAYQAQRCFKHLYDFLAPYGYHLIGVDLPGHGQTAPIPANLIPTPELWSMYLKEVLEAANLSGERLVFCAWSLGGSVVRNYLLDYGHEEVAGLILIASLFGYEHYLPHCLYNEEAQEALLLINAIYDQKRSLQERHHVFDQFFRRLTVQPLSTDDVYETYGYNERAFWNLSTLGSEYLMQDRPGDTTQLLKSIDAPSLMIHGRQDSLIAPSYSQQLVATLRHSTLRVYDDCGHSPLLEQPMQMNHDVLSFLITQVL